MDINLPVLDPVDALVLLKRAWDSGRPIVPLFGAGMSMEAGIPGTSALAEYLAKVKYLKTPHEGDDEPYGSPLARFGLDEWPSYFDVNRLILGLRPRFPDAQRAAATDPQGPPTSDRDVLSGVLQNVLREPFADVPIFSSEAFKLASFDDRERFLYSAFANWRTLLRRLAAGDASNVKTFFREITAGRRPTKGHLFAASLSRLFGWRLMLSTNFDSLLEESLGQLGRRAVVLTLPDRGPLELARDHAADITLLKLHGGSFSNRFSDVLDAAPDHSTIRTFLDLLPPRALVLVLGYRGGDQRVMSLLSSYLRDRERDSPGQPQLVWVCRTNAPSSLRNIFQEYPNLSRDVVVLTRFASVTAFLQELYTRLTLSFPACGQRYQATSPLVAPPIARTPGQTNVVRAPNGGNEGNVPSTTIFVGATPRMGSSTALAAFARSYERTHVILWIDLEEIHSLDDLVDTIFAQLRVYDPTLPHLSPASGHNGSDFVGQRPDPRSQRLLEALRRGRYLLALDSMGEFGRAFAAHDLTAPAADVASRYRELLDFLLGLARQSNHIGDSLFAIVLAPPHLPVYAPPSFSEEARFRPPTPTRAEREQRLEIPSTELTPPDQLLETMDFQSRGRGPTTFTLGPAIRGREALRDLFEFLELLGEGGFGHVWLVRDRQLGHLFALKLFKTEDSLARQDRLAEARRAIQLNHQHIVRVYRVSDPHEPPFVLYDFIPGVSLDRLIHNDHFTLWQRVRVLSDIGSALTHSHSQAQIVHGDLKPHNILVREDGVGMLIDFGVGATPVYMSPEEYRSKHPRPGETSDPYDAYLSDVFSFGLVLFELVARRRAIREPSELETYLKPPSLHEAFPSAPHSLDHICSRCLAARPSERYRSMAELAEALDSWLREEAAGQLGGAVLSRPNPKLQGTFQDALEEFERMPNDVAQVIVPGGTTGYFSATDREDALRRVLQERVNLKEHRKQIVGHGNTALAALQLSWNYLKPTHQTILAIAAAFRRPRSLIALRLIGGVALQRSELFVLAVLEKLDHRSIDAGFVDPQFAREASWSGRDRLASDEDVDRILRDLDDAGFLLRQEGGYYWMHAGTRDAVYHSCAQKEPRGMANLHEMIAYYYYEMVYLRARDIRAFFEFVFHQIVAFRDGSAETRYRRLRTLSAAFRRERTYLLARAHHRAVLDCIQTLREHEFKPLEQQIEDNLWSIAAGRRPTHPEIKESDPVALLQEIRGFASFLSDLEADVHRRLTDYGQCIQVRLEQIEHRCAEVKLPRRELVGDVRSKIHEILRTLPNRTKKVLHESDELGAKLASELWDLFDALLRSCPVAEPVVSHPTVRRMVDHLFDIASSLAGLHDHVVASHLFHEVRGLVERQLPFAARPVDPDEAFEIVGQATPRRGITEDTMRWANATRTQASLRVMESWNARVYTWPPRVKEAEAISNIVNEAAIAGESLGMLADRDPEQYIRSGSWLKTLVARAHYLGERFDKAHFLLDSAVALVDSAKGVKASKALALCNLRRAECHLLESDSILSKAVATDPLPSSTPSEVSAPVPPGPPRPEPGTDLSCVKAEMHLMLAGDALLRAKEILSEEAGHVWLWTMLYLEEAQLYHEQIVFSIARREQGEEGGRAVEYRGWILRQALSSISAGCDNIAKDRVRWQHFRTLWWQLFVCLSYDFREKRAYDCWDFWRQLNTEASLTWYLEMLEQDTINRRLKQLERLWRQFHRQAKFRLNGWADRAAIVDIETKIVEIDRTEGK